MGIYNLSSAAGVLFVVWGFFPLITEIVATLFAAMVTAHENIRT